MNGGVHWIFLVSALAAMVYFKIIVFPSFFAAIVFFAFAILWGFIFSPDIDQYFGIRSFIKHRGFTHGLVWIALTAGLSYYAVSYAAQSHASLAGNELYAAAGAVLGCLIHDFADLLGKIIGQH